MHQKLPINTTLTEATYFSLSEKITNCKSEIESDIVFIIRIIVAKSNVITFWWCVQPYLATNSRCPLLLFQLQDNTVMTLCQNYDFVCIECSWFSAARREGWPGISPWTYFMKFSWILLWQDFGVELLDVFEDAIETTMLSKIIQR